MFVSEIGRCEACGATRPLTGFDSRTEAPWQRDLLCRGCRAACRRENYLAAKARFRAEAAERAQAVRLERTARLNAWLEEQSCADCGEADPHVLELDDVADEEFVIGVPLGERALTSETRIARCDVVCANCRRRRVSHRAGTARVRLGPTVR